MAMSCIALTGALELGISSTGQGRGAVLVYGSLAAAIQLDVKHPTAWYLYQHQEALILQVFRNMCQ